MNETPTAPVHVTIIKRKKVVKADGHHGGAWKVAYADFVTAMMAFFLLMWLLNATTEDQRKGLADYFNPTIPISRISGGGADGLNGSSIFTEDTLPQMGTGASRRVSVAHPAGETDDATEAEARGQGGENAGAAQVQATEEQLNSQVESLQSALSEGSHQLADHVLVKMTPEGIVLEIVDSDSTELFPVGRSDSTPLLEELLTTVASHFDRFGNQIKVVGHTDNSQFNGARAYDNWDLSADRANTARRLLINHNVAPDRIVEVAGKADTQPLDETDPSAPQNRRISIIILI